MTLARRLFDPGFGGSRFSDEIAAELEAGRGTLVIVPKGFAIETMGEAVRRRLWEAGRDVQVLDVQASATGSPTLALARALEVREAGDDLVELEDCVRGSAGMPHVLELAGLGGLPRAARSEWLRSFEKWSCLARLRADGQPPRPALWINLAPDPEDELDFAKESPRLCVRAAWGLASEGDRQRLVEGTPSDLPDEQSDEQCWRQAVLPPLIAGDLALGEVLWSCLASLEVVHQALVAEAGRRGWTQAAARGWIEQLLALQGEVILLTGPSWRKQLRGLWARGVVDHSPGEGLQLSSAALAQGGETVEVQHRYWAGQVRLLFPLLDRVRLFLCRALTARYGRGWVSLVPLPEREPFPRRSSDPLAFQLGDLEVALARVPELRRYRELASLVQQARAVRNELAHYRPITFASYQQLLSSISAAGTSI